MEDRIMEGKVMEGNQVRRFLGGSPGQVLVQLIVVSFIVGLVLNVLGVSPFDIVDGLKRLAFRIYSMGFGTVEWMVRYLLLGAVVVVPIWLVLRILKMGRRSGG